MREREVEATQEACLALGLNDRGASAVRVGGAPWEERSPPQSHFSCFRVVKGLRNQPKPESSRNVALENGSPHSPRQREAVGH